MPESHASLYYRAHRDWWVSVLGVVLVALFLSVGAGAMWSTIVLWERAILIGVALLLAVSIIDKIFFTVYELGPDKLVMHTQLRRITIPYREMIEIVPGGFRNLFSTRRRKRFALSLHSLTIKVRDQYWDEVSISPDAHDVFLDQLLGRIDKERSRRATVSRKK